MSHPAHQVIYISTFRLFKGAFTNASFLRDRVFFSTLVSTICIDGPSREIYGSFMCYLDDAHEEHCSESLAAS